MADTSKSAGADGDIALGDITGQNESSADGGEDDPESVLATFREEWQRELGSAPNPKGLAHSSQRSPYREAPLVTPTTPKGSPRISKVPVTCNQAPEGQGNNSNKSTNTVDGDGFPYTGDNLTTSTSNASRVEDEIKPDIVIKATELFNKAVELEQSRRLYEAIQFYRRAMTLVPDIEFRVHRQNVLDPNEGYRGAAGGSGGAEGEQSKEDDLDQDELQDLVMRFQILLASSPSLCVPQFDQEAPHISCLPPEMFERIMQWVVGSDLDMRSLEQVSKVCHGFYLLARNPEIWHKACLRVWGMNCGVPGVYGSWREMFLRRPHPRYNGCYISRTTYFRPGESGFQDENYHPWHVVQYYRYIRFFTDGVVSMLTTSDEPQTVVSQLRSKETKNSQVLQGHYRIHGSIVSLVLQRRTRERMFNRRKGRRYIGGTTDVAENIFQIELEIRPLKQRPHWMLVWRSYNIVSIYYDNKQNTSQIDVNDTSKFPPLTFSRVKSYTGNSEYPLI